MGRVLNVPSCDLRFRTREPAQPTLIPGMHCPPEQMSPEPQQPQPHGTLSGSHVIGRHWPLLQIWPQPHAGEQVLPPQTPFLQVAPPEQPQVPPQPSLPPHVPSPGHWGAQQAFW